MDVSDGFRYAPIINIQFRSRVRCGHKTKKYRISDYIIRNELNEIGHHPKLIFLFSESM